MLKLGVIGMSEGNGHPYSWSSIVNGQYNEKEMANCGYAGIPVYLAANRDTLGIEGAKVTCVWAQERKIAEHIAKASLIDTVVDRLEDMIGKVDAVMLTRDDPENHVAMAAIGKVELATAVGKKDWTKYGVHMLEGLFALLDDSKAVSVRHISSSHKDIVYIEFETGVLATVHLFYDITPTFQISVFGQGGWRLIEYKNWYAMFRNNIIEFVRSVQQGRSRLEFSKTENIIRTLIAGKESLEQGGRVISLK
jgi:hypothetical protein